MWEKGRRGAGARFSTGAVAASLALVLVSTVLAGSVLPTPIGEDTYTNAESQHKTQVASARTRTRYRPHRRPEDAVEYPTAN